MDDRGHKERIKRLNRWRIKCDYNWTIDTFYGSLLIKDYDTIIWKIKKNFNLIILEYESEFCDMSEIDSIFLRLEKKLALIYFLILHN